MRALALATLLLLPLAARAADEAHHGPDWTLLALQVLNTAILLFVLVRFGRRPLNDFLRQRRQSIAERIDDAQAKLQQARAELGQWQSRLERFDREAAELVGSAEQQARAEGERNLARTQQAAERVREDARSVADQEIERARRALRKEAAELAISLASEILRENLAEDDDRRLIAGFASHVEEQQ